MVETAYGGSSHTLDHGRQASKQASKQAWIKIDCNIEWSHFASESLTEFKWRTWKLATWPRSSTASSSSNWQTIWIIPSYLSDCFCNLWPSTSASESSWGLVALVLPSASINTKVTAKWVKFEYIRLAVESNKKRMSKHAIRFSPISFVRQNGNRLAACGPRTSLKHKNCRDKRMDLVKCVHWSSDLLDMSWREVLAGLN